MLEKILNFIPGQQNLEDDLRDHWHSAPHKIERLNIIKMLFRYGKEKRVRVTFLSGDVHLAAVGAIINQRDGLTGDNANVKSANFFGYSTSTTSWIDSMGFKPTW